MKERNDKLALEPDTDEEELAISTASSSSGPCLVDIEAQNPKSRKRSHPVEDLQDGPAFNLRKRK